MQAATKDQNTVLQNVKLQQQVLMLVDEHSVGPCHIELRDCDYSFPDCDDHFDRSGEDCMLLWPGELHLSYCNFLNTIFIS